MPGYLYQRQLEWEEREKAFFHELGERLRKILPSDRWRGLGKMERKRRVEKARDLLHREFKVKRPAALVWTDDLSNAGAGYDETSPDGDIHYPSHHLVDAESEHIVRGLTEEMRHAWQDDVHRGLTAHPLGELGKRAFDHAFATYDEHDPLNDTTNLLELDAKERAEWCVEGYVGRADGEET